MLAALLAALLLAQTPPPPAAPPRPPRARVAPPPAPGLPGAEPRLLGEWPERPSGKRVTLEDKASVDDALEQIADAAGWNLVANTGSAGDRMLVLALRDVPVEDALRAVLQGTALAASRRGDTVTVAPSLAPPAEAPVLSGFDRPSGRKVTADFADAPVDAALQKISGAAGLSVVLPPGLRGAVTAHFRDTPVEEALRAVLAQAGLSAAREGSVLTVSRESGPRVIISGGKRHFQFEIQAPDAEEIGSLAGEARREADEARREAQEAVADAREKVRPKSGRHGPDRVASGDVTLSAGERARDVVAIRGSVRLAPGARARQVTAVLGSVELGPGAVVEQEAVAVGGDVHVSPGARVGKDAVSVGGQLVIDPGGEVEGEQTSIAIPGLTGMLGLAGSTLGLSSRHSPLLFAGHVLSQFVVYFALGLLLLVFFPRRLDAVAASLVQDPGKATLVGLLGTLAQPVLLVLLVVTIIGIPLVAVQVLAVLVAGLLGFTALALLVGRRIPLRVERGLSVLQLAIGTALVVAVAHVPIVGPLAWVVAWLVVFGAVLRTRFGRPEAATPIPTTPVPPATPGAPG